MFSVHAGVFCAGLCFLCILDYFVPNYFVFSVHARVFCVFCACWSILCFLCMLEYFVFSVHAGVFCAGLFYSFCA